ncbi:hypothetical protein BDC45DRAFT_534759 [Circinella umbellata]|nr:hypothetical protein BDC45DRAFT_534759 [Circinella umbellata]
MLVIRCQEIASIFNRNVESLGLSSYYSKTSSDTPWAAEVKGFVSNIHTTKLKYAKWNWMTGKNIQDNMHAFVQECLYEHIMRKLTSVFMVALCIRIFDIMDSCWKKYFKDHEINEIRTYHKPVLKPLPVEITEYLNKLSGVDITPTHQAHQEQERRRGSGRPRLPLAHHVCWRAFRRPRRAENERYGRSIRNLACNPLDPPPPSGWLVVFLRRLRIDLQQQQQQ